MRNEIGFCDLSLDQSVDVVAVLENTHGLLLFPFFYKFGKNKRFIRIQSTARMLMPNNGTTKGREPI